MSMVLQTSAVKGATGVMAQEHLAGAATTAHNARPTTEP